MTDRNQPLSDAQMRDIVALGRKHLKTAFPNPGREGCPNNSILRAMAYRKLLSLVDLPISHVVTCSPCYQEYIRHRRTAVLMRALQVTVASLAVSAALLATLQVVRNYTSRRGQPGISQKQPTGPQERAANKPVPARAVPVALTVDLAPFSPTRGDHAPNLDRRVQFPRKSLRVKFLLPLGMEPGEYDVRLQDASGNAFIDTRQPGTLNDGITSVEVDLNFTDTSQSRFILMIRPPGLSWRTFPVVVQ
jgi:hypothetical protein